MAKREEAGSGLRAGFISEAEAMRQQKRHAEPEPAPKPSAEPKEAVVKPQPKPETETATPSEPSEADRPTVEMQGISGKVISGVIKVVKKRKRPAKAMSDVDAKVQPTRATQIQTASPEVDSGHGGGQSAQSHELSKHDISRPVAQAKPVPSTPIAPPAKTPPIGVDSQKPRAAVPQNGPMSSTAETGPSAHTSVSATTETLSSLRPSTPPAPQGLAPERTPGPSAPMRSERVRGVKAERPAPTPRPPRASTSHDHGRARPQSDVRHASGPSESSGELKRPKPPQPTPLANRPAPFRPQRGSYVGSQADTPARMRRPSGPSRGGSARGGVRPAFGERRSFGDDKDRDESPRQTRSPYPNRPKPTMPSDLGGRRGGGRAPQRDARRRHDRNDVREDKREGTLPRPTRGRRKKSDTPTRPQQQLTHVELPAVMTVKALAEYLKKTTTDVIMKLMGYGVMVAVNQEIDYDTAEIVANEFGIETSQIVEVSEEDILFDDSEDDEAALEPRPPVVVVMGHVDHGKTSILDYIRKASVASGEAGGITQHIGAYTVSVRDKRITFLDTPGHEAFTTMRARGAQVTDIAVLVVAADDGVMPQTVEAINHARAANTEIIVAINKIDRPQANVQRVRQELAQHNLMSSDWGGETTIVEVSAKTGQNMDELLDMILLTADVLDLKANPNRQAKGTVIEAKLDNARGPVATLLVQRGTLSLGDTIVVSATIGNIRAMSNDRGEAITSAGPSTPVEILGLPEVPEGGDIFYAVENERVGRTLVEKRRAQAREEQLRRSSRMSLDTLFDKLREGEAKTLNVIVKADVQGSVEAVRQSLEKLSSDEVKVNVIHGAVGAVTESDVRLAEVSNAIIIGFSVRPTASATELASTVGVDIRMYRVIYNAIEDIEAAMKGLLAPDTKEVVSGHAEVRNTFRISGVGTIAGCYVLDGKISRNHAIRVVRDGIVVYEGAVASLKRFKDNVREVTSGYECGIGIEKFNDVKVGDVFESFTLETEERETT